MPTTCDGACCLHPQNRKHIRIFPSGRRITAWCSAACFMVVSKCWNMKVVIAVIWIHVVCSPQPPATRQRSTRGEACWGTEECSYRGVNFSTLVDHGHAKRSIFSKGFLQAFANATNVAAICSTQCFLSVSVAVNRLSSPEGPKSSLMYS